MWARKPYRWRIETEERHGRSYVDVGDKFVHCQVVYVDGDLLEEDPANATSATTTDGTLVLPDDNIVREAPSTP